MAAIEFAGQLRCLSDLGQLPARRKEKKLGWPSSFLNGGCYIDRTLDVFFFQPHFLIYTVLFLIILNIIGRKKKSEGERKRKRPAARLICFASCSAPQMVVNAVAGRQAPIREVAQTHTAAAIMDLSLWTSSYLYGRLYGVISV